MKLFAIALREWQSFFRLPVGWAVVALYLLMAGWVFALETLRPDLEREAPHLLL